MKKVTMKIFSDVYKELQLIKIETESVSLSDTIKILIDSFKKDK